jgi:hypothetical protein
MVSEEFKRQLKGSPVAGISKINKKIDFPKRTSKSKGTKKKEDKKGIIKQLTQKITSKKIMKPSQMTVKIPEYRAPSVLGDPNRFFKDEYEQERRNLFLR